MENQNLKPCPFCGGEAYEYEDTVNFIYPERGFGIACTKCKSSTELSRTKEEAVAAWNKRVERQSIKPNNLNEHLSIGELLYCLEDDLLSILNRGRISEEEEETLNADIEVLRLRIDALKREAQNG